MSVWNYIFIYEWIKIWLFFPYQVWFPQSNTAKALTEGAYSELMN